MAIPPIGAKLKTKNFHTVTVQKKLGAGGQGTVFLVDYDGKPKALKWYHPHIFKTPEDMEKFYENVSTNVENGSPSQEFLWPEDVTQIRAGSFGYIMDLRPPRFHELSKLLVGRKVRFKNYAVRVEAMINLVSAFRLLHNQGYAYQDLNDGNFFFDPNTGECLICDNDNALYQGNHTGILGKQRYMAPEIVLGQKMPDKATDRYSLSVILFMMLLAYHPLEGQYSTQPCMTKNYEYHYYGKKPIFVFDPADTRNRPVEQLRGRVEALWNQLPEYLRAAFETSFSKQAMTFCPQTGHYGRPRLIEREWLSLLSRFRSSVYTCACGNEQIVSKLPDRCEHCQKQLPIRNMLQLKKYAIPLYPGVSVLRCQVEECGDKQALDVVLTVSAGSGTYVITNKSDAGWECVTTKGQTVQLLPDCQMPVLAGIKGKLLDTPFEII